MAVDMFLSISDVAGESVDATHADEIDIHSFSWGMENDGTAHEAGGAGTGKVSVHDLTVFKYVDKATPALMKLCCNGKHFATATLTVRKSGGDPIEYFKIEMSNGLVAAVEPGASKDDDRIPETLRLNFASFVVTYTPQDDAGQAQGEVPAGWNIATNEPM